MSAPAELTHVAETVEIFKVDVGHISAAELLTQGRHSSPRAAGSVISDEREIIIFSSSLALTGAQGVTTRVRPLGPNLYETFNLHLSDSDLSQVSLKSISGLFSLCGFSFRGCHFGTNLSRDLQSSVSGL